MAYLIQGETLTGIANQARRLTGASGQMTPAQIAAALSGVSPGGGADSDTAHDTLRFSTNASRSFYDYGDSAGNIGNVGGNQLVEIKMPLLAEILAYQFDWTSSALKSAYFPACMSVGYEAFMNCAALETLTLNSGCVIDEYAFLYVIAPEDKTFRLYLRGNSMGTCPDNVFGNLDKESSSYDGMFDPYFETGVIPGLEIYVPASLLNSFKTTWAGGAFANNIYALTE